MTIPPPLLQTHAESTLAKADLALREKEEELARLSAEQQALRAELAAVKEGLCSSTERAEKLQEEGQVRRTSDLLHTAVDKASYRRRKNMK